MKAPLESHRKPRKKAEPAHPLEGRKARVCVERVGLSIIIEDVAAVESGVVACELLNVFRALGAKYPELREYPDVTPGGTPVDVPDDEEWVEERRRKVGFSA